MSKDTSRAVGSPRVTWLATGMLIAALALVLLGALLFVPGSHGIEDFLASPREQFAAEMRGAWSGRTAFVGAYLGLDSLALVPAYVGFGLALGRGLVGAGRTSTTRVQAILAGLLALPVLSLALIDFVENSVGALRVGWGVGLVAVTTAALGAYLLWHTRTLAPVFEACKRACEGNARGAALGLSAVAFVALLLLVLAAFAGDTCTPDTQGLDALLARWGCAAHRAKHWLVAVVLFALGTGCLAWIVGLDPQSFEGRERKPDVARSRAALRAAIGDILGRSRYVLGAVALIGGLTLVMDQARDIVYAMAAFPNTGGFFEQAKYWSGSICSFLCLIIATGALEFSCWLWTRSVCQLRPASLSVETAMSDAAMRTAPLGGSEATVDLADTFAKYWARAVAFLPVLFLVLLCARVIQDAVVQPQLFAASNSANGAVFTILASGFILLGFGVWLLWRHGTKQFNDYYASMDWAQWAKAVDFLKDAQTPKSDSNVTSGAKRPNNKYGMLLGTIKPERLPFVLCGLLLACRLVDVFPSQWVGWSGNYVPTMTLAVAMLSVAFWLCFFGWLSILEVHQSIPWFGLLIVLIGGLGAVDLTDNHRVWSPIEGSGVPDSALFRMWCFSTLLALLMLAAYSIALRVARAWPDRATQSPFGGATLVGACVVVVAVGLTLFAADKNATARPVAGAGRAALAERHTLDRALVDWFEALAAKEANSPRVPVYFISTEGGGIRAAVWTAFVLERLAQSDPRFLDRTFSISGVSGGAVGAAAFRACDLYPPLAADGTPNSREACLMRFARTDMVAPVISAWMFEDVLARVLPTSGCTTPSCGVLSRGAWFEQALELGAPGLRPGLVASTQVLRAQGKHLPHLLLNATWVETGERAVASDLRIDYPRFPAAKDQLFITGTDLPLGTAAHNAARFPYINAIGSLHAPVERCRSLKPESTGHEVPADPGPVTNPEVCGHLADGGYFDNSGGQSTLDVIRGFAACLGEKADPDTKAYPDCLALSEGTRAWAQTHLVPHVLMIRNGADPSAGCTDTCPFTRKQPPALDASARQDEKTPCPSDADPGYHPDRPECSEQFDFFIGLAGPALTVVNVAGTGGNGRLAEARQSGAVRALRGRMGGEAAKSTARTALTADLVPDGILYPLGWHLSPAAVVGMWEQAGKLRL